MASIVMIPKKTEYMISEVKSELKKQVEDATIANKGQIKELNDYINTLHVEVQTGLAKVKKISKEVLQSGSSKMLTDMSIELANIYKQFESFQNMNHDQNHVKIIQD